MSHPDDIRKGPVMTQELTAKKNAALNRLKTVRGHLDGIIRMLETDAYCVDVMKQISAVQSALERTNRVMLHNHLETCFSQAVLGGQGATAIDELVDALKFSPALTGPDARLNGTITDEAVEASTA
ncbi:MAG: CsoR family transcriptional regulator, copper-sensing transcriptional repressor [Mycobacterium sp.]|jgi:DNA-binding FrmR family transcriptional regulator|nr:CsoR family transcriptional regulator, copper-sensing transcriptional repressor [Mycobacterium sp.]